MDAIQSTVTYVVMTRAAFWSSTVKLVLSAEAAENERILLRDALITLSLYFQSVGPILSAHSVASRLLDRGDAYLHPPYEAANRQNR